MTSALPATDAVRALGQAGSAAAGLALPEPIACARSAVDFLPLLANLAVFFAALADLLVDLLVDLPFAGLQVVTCPTEALSEVPVSSSSASDPVATLQLALILTDLRGAFNIAKLSVGMPWADVHRVLKLVLQYNTHHKSVPNDFGNIRSTNLCR